MTAETIARRIAAEQGWGDHTLLDLVQTYVENQQSPDALADYLRTVAEEENSGSDEAPDDRLAGSADDIIDAQGWTVATLLDLLWQFVENQQDNTAFEDYLRSVADEENSADENNEDEDDEFPGECANCGNPISETGWDRTGSRRCDDLDPEHKYHYDPETGSGHATIKVWA